MSEEDWGVGGGGNADFSGVSLNKPEEQEEEEPEVEETEEPEETEAEQEEEKEKEKEETAENVATKAGERLEESLGQKLKLEEDEEEPEEESDVVEFRGDATRTRYEVTLRKALLEDELQEEVESEYFEDRVQEVRDAELLMEVYDELSDMDLVEQKEAVWEQRERIGDLTTDHLIQEGEYRYLPVFGFNINHVCTVPYRDADASDYEFDSIFVGDKVLSWWEDDSLTPKHPYLLLNPIDSTKNTNHTANGVPYREIFRLPKSNQIAFSDSGGFQMVSRPDAGRADSAEEHDWQNAVLHPETVLDWQIDNADGGPILDHPPYGTAGESSIFAADDDNLAEWLDEPFLSYAEKTTENAEAMQAHLAKRREDPNDARARDYRMFGVIQGHTYDESLIDDNARGSCRTLSEDKYGDDESRPHWYMLERWHEMVDATGDYKNWALSPTPCTSPGQIAMHLAYADDRCEDAEWFHVLQVGSSVNIALIQFYAMLADDKFVTSDASSHNRGSKYRQFMLPPGFGKSVTISDRDDYFERHPCNCQACKTVEDEHGFEYIGDGADSKRNATINMHNLTMQLQSQRILDALMRAEQEEVIAGIRLSTDGTEIKRYLSPFWKQLRDVTTQAKIKAVYAGMLYLYSSVHNGLQEQHDVWIKEPEYRQVEDEPEDDGVVNEGSDAMNWGDGGARVKDEEEEPEEEEEEEDEEEETRDLTDEEEKYLSLPTVTFEEPEEKNYYYQHSATISGGMTEFDLNVTRDARLIDW
jgi:hypothetical protein